MTNRKWCVYVHTNKINGKKYVGITGRDVWKRWANGKGYKNQLLGSAIDKYGWDNFTHEILQDTLTEKEAKALEKLYISMFNTKSIKYGYNLTDGGDGITGLKHSVETRDALSKSRKGELNPMYGKHLSSEAKIKLSNVKKGRIYSEEHKNKISAGTKGLKHHRYWEGKTRSDATKEKISRNNSMCKKVICEDTVYRTVRECASYYEVNYQTMSNWLAGNRKMPQKYQEMGLSYYEEYSDK